MKVADIVGEELHYYLVLNNTANDDKTGDGSRL